MTSIDISSFDDTVKTCNSKSSKIFCVATLPANRLGILKPPRHRCHASCCQITKNQNCTTWCSSQSLRGKPTPKKSEYALKACVAVRRYRRAGRDIRKRLSRGQASAQTFLTFSFELHNNQFMTAKKLDYTQINPKPACKTGDDGARIHNPRLAKPVLSQLSYVPERESFQQTPELYDKHKHLS